MIKPFSFLIALVLTTAAFAADVTPHSLTSDAGSQYYWLARNIHPTTGSDLSDIYNRAFSQDDNWTYVTRLFARVDAIAAQDSAAGALTSVASDGSWMVLYSGQTIVPGAALPGATRMMALAAAGRDWWAIGDVPGGMEAVRVALERSHASTKPSATRPAVSTTQPASTQPALPHESVLFKLEGNEWNPVATLPEGPAIAPLVTLSVVENVPYVATYDTAAVSVYKRGPGAWMPITRIPNADKAKIASFKLFKDGSLVRLWLQMEDGPDQLYRLDNPKLAPLSLSGLKDIPANDRTAAQFGQSFRIVGATTQGIFEQRFALDTGEAQGKPVALQLPTGVPLGILKDIHQAILFVSMLLVFVCWVRVQSADGDDAPEPKPLPFAPIGRRLAAGLIDLAPVILTMLFFTVQFHNVANSQYKFFMLLLAYWASGLFYVLLTTLSEVVGGRSLGKIMLGLKVVTRQGETPTPVAMFTRNVLRMFDLSIFFLPVVAIVFSPTHQRAGDLAAGTVVIYDEAPANDDAKES